MSESKTEAKILNLSADQYMEYMLKYYKLLSDGRVKPDSRGSAGTIRESNGECDAMEQIKAKLAHIFKLDTSIKFITNNTNNNK